MNNNTTVGIIYHPKIAAAEALTHDLHKKLTASGYSVWACSSWDEEKAQGQVMGTSMLISIGGDGTILKAARIVVPWSVPIVGINMGKLGFMTEVSAKDALDKIPTYLDGEGWIDERAMLQAEINSADTRHPLLYALNDVVVGRGAKSRVVHIKTEIDGSYLTTYKADGVIAATATGSTGYALSAGGPILNPQSKDIVLQPIAAHLTLSTALVLASTSTIELQVESDHQAILSIDGQIEVPLLNGDIIRIQQSQHTTRFLRHNPAKFYYETLMLRLANRS